MRDRRKNGVQDPRQLALSSHVDGEERLFGAFAGLHAEHGVLNPVLTPITHPLLPSAAAPGQMSYAAVQQALHLLGQIPARQYYLFGQSWDPTTIWSH
jgi:hypothetical protein